jgi:archaellum component FlaC
LAKNRVILGEILPEKPENFEKNENKYKLTLLQMGKRFVDLETSITELKDKINEIGSQGTSSLQQRIDDLEDLIMVEQAGILELKKMMEEAKEKEKIPDVSSIVSKSNERINSIEKEVSSIKQKIIPKTEVDDKIRKLENDISAISIKSPPTSLEMETLHKNFDDLSSQFRSFSSRTENNLKGMYEKIKEIETKEPIRPGVDFDLLSSKIESLRISFDSMTKKKIEMDLKIVEIEKKFEIIENRIRESVSESIMDEIKSNRKDLMTANIRVDSLERVARELVSGTQNLENSMKKFESLERITLLNKDIEDKIERFKFIEDDTKRLSSKVEMIYGDIQKKLMVMGSLERNISRLNENVSSVTKELNKNKIDIANKVSSESIRGLEKKFEEMSNDIKNKIGGFSAKAQVTDDLFVKINERVNLVENRYRNLVENMKKTEVKQKPEDLQRILGSLTSHESRLSQVSSQVSNIHQRISSFEKDVQQKVIELKTPNIVDEQISELLNKIVFLESRLGAVESLMQKTQDVSRVQPVILE